MIEIKDIDYADMHTVEISQAEYKELLKAKHDLDRLIKAMIDNAGLSYSNSALRFSDDEIAHVVKFITPELYKARLAELQDQNEA